MQTQGSKNSFCHKKPKSKDPKSAPLHDNTAELPKKDNKKDKKKRFQGQKREYIENQKEQTLAISIITINVSKIKRRSVTLVRSYISTGIRKATLPTTAPSQKTSIGLGNLRAGDWW